MYTLSYLIELVIKCIYSNYIILYCIHIQLFCIAYAFAFGRSESCCVLLQRDLVSIRRRMINLLIKYQLLEIPIKTDGNDAKSPSTHFFSLHTIINS